MWKAKILETKMANNLEGMNSTVSGQGQTLKYVIHFGQKIRSYLGNLQPYAALEGIGKQDQGGHC